MSRDGVWSTPGLRAAVASRLLVLLVAVGQMLATLVDLYALGAPGGGRLYYLAVLIWCFLAAVVNCLAIVLAIVDLSRGRLRIGLFVCSVVFQLWHGLMAVVAARADDPETRWYFTFHGFEAGTVAYHAVMAVLVAVALVLLAAPGRWKWGMREIRLRARGYYTADLPVPASATYPPMSGEGAENAADRPPAAGDGYRPTHL